MEGRRSFRADGLFVAVHDLDAAVVTLRVAANVHARRAGSERWQLPVDLLTAAVGFTIQLAVELAVEQGRDVTDLRALERALIDRIQRETPAKESPP